MTDPIVAERAAMANPIAKESAVNPIVAENAREGARHWWGKHAPAHTIEAYTSQCSAHPGERIGLHVSTRPAARYRIEVYRLGWYGGRGARLVACVPQEGDLQGLAREIPAPRPGPQIDVSRLARVRHHPDRR